MGFKEVWNTADILVDFFQQCGFVFTIGLTWTSNGLGDVAEFFSGFVEGDAYVGLTIFAGVLCILNFTLILAGIGGLSCLQAGFWDEFLFYLFDFIIGMFFIPLMTAFLELFHCVDQGDISVLSRSSSVECGSVGHVFLCIMAVISMLIVLVGAVVKASLNNDRSHSKKNTFGVRNDINFMKGKYLVYRLWLVCLTIWASPGLALAAIILTSGFLPPIYVIWNLPYRIDKINFLRAGLYGAKVWVFVCAVVTSIIDDSENPASSYMLIAGPVFAGLCVALAVYRRKKMPDNRSETEKFWEENNSKYFTMEDQPYLHTGVEGPVNMVTFLSEEGLTDFVESVKGDSSLTKICFTLSKEKQVDKKGKEVGPPYQPDGQAFTTLMSALTMGEVGERIVHLAFKGWNFQNPEHSEIGGTVAGNLSGFSSLEYLDLSACGVNDDLASSMAEAFTRVSTLKTVHLGSNPIHEEVKDSMKALVKEAGRTLRMRF